MTVLVIQNVLRYPLKSGLNMLPDFSSLICPFRCCIFSVVDKACYGALTESNVENGVLCITYLKDQDEEET